MHARSRLLPIIAVLTFGFFAASARNANAKSPANSDDDCLACHNNKDLRDDSGHGLYVDPVKRRAGVHGILGCTTCHTDIKEYPHPAHIRQVDCAACHAEEAADVPNSVHGALGSDACVSCHGVAHNIRGTTAIMPAQCASCHQAEVKDFLASAHGSTMEKGNTNNTSCGTCHGPVHKILSSDDPLSPVAKKNQPDTCGACHSNLAFLAKYKIPFARPVETYRGSVHGRAVAEGNAMAASCSDCHSAHLILSGRNEKSKTNHWNIPATCGACHTGIKNVYEQSVHGTAVARGAADAPVCTDCHGEHAILAPSNPDSLVSPARVSIVTCGRCHGDQRIAARYNLPADRVPTFADSFHGLASRAGSQTVANCASCHGVHNIFPTSDPRSTVNAANIGATCGACHAGAGDTFAIGPVHIGIASRSESAAVKWIRRFYWTIIPITLAFMLFHHATDFLRKARAARRHSMVKEVPRMNLHFRIAHWMVVGSFPVLVLTGFALKFPEAWWAQPLLVLEGRFAFRAALHRAAALVLVAAILYHVVHLFLVRRDRAILVSMKPGLADLRHLQNTVLYNLGLTDTRPMSTGCATYVEKIEYWAFVWGTWVMAVTGSLLWFNNFTLRYFPKWVSDAATTLHYYEAILATLSILVWHMYTVVFDPEVYPMDRSWITGVTASPHARHAQPAPKIPSTFSRENASGEPAPGRKLPADD